MFAGAIMMHELLRQPLLNWIVPLALILGLLLLGGVALEVMKAKVRTCWLLGRCSVAGLWIRACECYVLCLSPLRSLGAIMMHELLRQPLLNWILPLALILGLLLLGGIALEVMKAKVRASPTGLSCFLCC
jgi:hypothetical protein